MNIVIIGAGHAGGLLAANLVRLAPDFHVTLVGDEAHPPYQRPPLSKAYLAGTLAEERLYLRKADYYDNTGVNRLQAVKAIAIDRNKKTVLLQSGDVVPYDKLIIATGGSSRRLSCKGADLLGVFGLRGIDDVKALRAEFQNAENIVIAGGGYIGLEVAAVARKLGKNVHVIEREDRLLARVATPELSQFFKRLHREEGVHVHEHAEIATIEGQSRCEGVLLKDGQRIAADLVITGIGIEPNTSIAKMADLVIDNGILVDEFLTSSDPDIHALGDCANAMNLFLGRWARLESVQNAVDQAQALAQTLVGKKTPYRALPWFWSDQYDIKYQSVGLPQSYDEIVVRGDIKQGRNFSLFYLKDDRMIAADCINHMKDFMVAKRLIGEAVAVQKEHLSDTAFDLKTLFQKPA